MDFILYVVWVLVVSIFIIPTIAYNIINCCNYSKEWDFKLKELLDKDIEHLGIHTVVINGTKIWVSNYIYSYGNSHGTGLYPSVITRYRLNSKVREYKKELDLKKINEVIG